MRWRCVVAVVGLVGSVLAPPSAAEALRVLVFNSTRFVDSGQTYLPPGSQESDNLQAALLSLGHAVTTIAGPFDSVGDCPFRPEFGPRQPGTLLATPEQYRAALGNTDVFLLPEQESWCYLPGELSAIPEIPRIWRDWVANGGSFVIHSSQEAKLKVSDLLRAVFGLGGIGGVDGTDVTTRKTAAAAGTLFANGPTLLAGNASTGLIPLSSLPPGALSIYDDGAAASVAIIPFGSGKIVFLGWDWTQSDPPFHGDGLPPFDDDGQNGGWYPTILDGAVKEAVSSAVTVALSGMGTVASDPAGMACTGGTCVLHALRGTRVTLTATAGPGALFGGWQGADCGGLGTCVLTVDRAMTLSATFTPVSGLALALAAERATASPGEMLAVDMAAANSGPALLVDLYLGLVLPPQLGGGLGCAALDPIAFVTDNFARISPTCRSAGPAAYPPLFRAITIPGALPATVRPGFWTLALPANAPGGSYTVFLVATRPGAFARGTIEPGDILAVATSSFAVSP